MRRILLVVALSALAWTPLPASAQDTTPVSSTTPVTLEEVDPVAPATVLETEALVTYSWGDGAVAPNQPTQVDVNASMDFGVLPAWAGVTVSPETLFFQPQATAGSSTQNVTVSVSPRAEAPAYIPASLTVTADAQPNGQINGSSGADSADVEVTNRPSVTAEPPVSVSFSGQTTLQVAVRNTGNGPVRVELAAVDAPDGIEATPGPALVLGPGDPVRRHARAGHLNVSSALQDDLARPETGNLSLRLEGSGSGEMGFAVAFGPTRGESSTLQTSSFGVQVEGAGLPVLWIALVFVAAVACSGGYVVYRDRGAGEPPLERADAGYDGESWVLVDDDGGDDWGYVDVDRPSEEE